MEYWKSTDHPLADVISSSFNAFDEYPVENFHSILRVLLHTYVSLDPPLVPFTKQYNESFLTS